MSFARNAVILGCFMLIGCQSEDARFKTEYERELPSAKPALDAIARALKTPPGLPECVKKPADTEPILVLELAGPDDSPELRLETSFNRAPTHPCHALTDKQFAMLQKPFKDYLASAPGPEPHKNEYLAALQAFKACTAGIAAIATVQSKAYDAVSVTDKTFVGGTLRSDIAIYTKTGDPLCLHHVDTRPASTHTVQVREGHPDDARTGILFDVGREHDKNIDWWLGAGAR